MMLTRAPFGFDGGLELSCDEPTGATLLATAPLPSRLFLEVGAGDRPTARLGALVHAGQPLSAGEAPVHAPTSGRLIAVQSRPTIRPGGEETPALVLEPDGLETAVDPDPADLDGLTATSLVEHLHNAGIVGMGGAGFPTHRKLARASSRGTHTLVINAVECEPGINADAALLAEHADVVLGGAATTARVLSLSRCLVGVDGRRGDVASALRAAIGRRDDGLEWRLLAVPPRYPAGAERCLVHALTGLRLGRNARPTDHGIVCFNVATLHAIDRATRFGEPLTRRVVSVSGAGAEAPGNYWVRIGHPVAAFSTTRTARITAGGTLAGWPVAAASAVHKTTIGLDFACATARRELPCIRCQRCADVCPEPLLPERLLSHARCGDSDALCRDGLDRCIECGACDAVCPSHIPLLATFRDAKAAVAAADSAAARARVAEQRHRRHQHRLEAGQATQERRAARRRRSRRANR